MIVWIAALALAAVVVAAIRRPTFFRLGWRYLRANPKQGSVAVVGLMVGMAVLVGTGITTDSAAAELERQLAQRRGITDVAIRFPQTPTNEVRAWLADPDVAPDVLGYGLSYRTRQVAVDPIGGAGLSDVAVVGVDDGYQEAVAWRELAQTEGEGVAITESLARALGATAGDEIRMSVLHGPSNDVRYEWVSVTQHFNATLVLAHVGPDGPEHSSEDLYRFTLTVPPYADHLLIDATPGQGARGNWSLVATDPLGNVHAEWGDTRPALDVAPPPFQSLPEGDWTIEVHAEAAAMTEAHVRAQLNYQRLAAGSPPGPPPEEPSAWARSAATFHGRIVAAAQGADGPVHAAQDVYRTTLDVPANAVTALVDLVTSSHDEAWTLVVTAPDGTAHTARQEGLPAPSAGARVNLQGSLDDPLEPGEWTVEVHPDAAAAETFKVRHHVVYLAPNPDYNVSTPKPVAVVHRVTAVVDDAADPDGNGIAVIMALQVAQELDGNPGVVNSAVLRLNEDADVKRSVAALQDAAGVQLVSTDLRSGPAREAAQLKQAMTEVWAFMGGFTIAASLLLVFVLIALLVDERRPILATMRAVGSQRADVAAMQTFEAVGYGVCAALLGTLTGFGLSVVLRRQSEPLFGGGRFTFEPWTIASAAVIVLGLLAVSAALAAYRSAGMDVASGLRGEADVRSARPWSRVVWASVLAAAAVACVPRALAGQPVLVTLGPSLAILSAGLFMSTRLGRHVVYPVVGGALLAWLALTYGVLADIETTGEALLLPARALAFCIAAALLLIYSRPIHSAIAAVASRVRGGFALEAALREVRGRPGRATLTVMMISMVILSVSVMQAFVAADAGQRWHDLGDYDVVATTDAPLGDVRAWLAQNPPANGLDPFANTAAWAHATWSPRMPAFSWSGGSVPARDGYGVSEGFAESADIPVLAGPDANTALREVRADPAAVVITADLSVPGGARPGVGDTLRFEAPEQELSLTVVAILDARWMASVFVHPDTLAVLANPQGDPRLVPGTAIFAEAAPGVDPDQVGRELAAGFRDAGMTWTRTGNDNAAEAEALAGMLVVFVMLALAVGAISLGLIAARNVIIRRREIGMARAVGAQRNLVVGMVLSETLYLVAIAVAIGFVGSAMTLLGMKEEAFRFDVAAAAGLAAYAFLLGAAAATVPAWHASRLRPAQAVRYVE